MAVHVENDDKVGLKQRNILWYLVFVGFSVNYLIRINVNIAIVDMIEKKTDRKMINHIASECLAVDGTKNVTSLDTKQANYNLNTTSDDIGERFPTIERYILERFKIEYKRNGFNWNSNQQGMVLGSFFWLHFMLQLPGGLLASRYGTKLVFGVANLSAVLIGCLIPFASYIDFTFLIFLRVFQGFICGVSWPAMHHMSSRWIPPNERSSFVTAYLGSSFGVFIFYPIFGWIMKYLSWEWIFHFSGLVGVIWWLLWQYFVYDTPADHPRIEPTEQNYIQEMLGSSLAVSGSETKQKIPWRKILTSRPLWVNTIAQFGGVYGLFTLLTQAPSYFRFVHGWDSTKIGILSGLPHLMRVVFAILVSRTADYLLRTNKMSRNKVRKLGTTICCIINGIFVLGLAYSGCNSMLACAFIILATGSHGAVSTGPLSAIIDISPNYAGILLGIVNSFCAIPGWIGPIIVSYLTFENQSVERWQYVFIICSAMLILSGLTFILFSDSSRQEWNQSMPKKDNVKNNEEECDLVMKPF